MIICLYYNSSDLKLRKNSMFTARSFLDVFSNAEDEVNFSINLSDNLFSVSIACMSYFSSTPVKDHN